MELLKRISHLESLVKKIDASKVTEDDFDLDETESEVPVDETASLSLADPHLNSPFNPFSNGVVEGKVSLRLFTMNDIPPRARQRGRSLPRDEDCAPSFRVFCNGWSTNSEVIIFR